MEYVSKFPKQVKSLSLIASGYETPVNSFLLEAAKNKPKAAIDKMMSWGFGRAGHFHQGTIPGNSMIAGGYKITQGNVPNACLLYTSPSPRDATLSRMPSSA